jgi:hypothetical protein
VDYEPLEQELRKLAPLGETGKRLAGKRRSRCRS